MEDVARRIKKTGSITSSADYQLNRYYILGNTTADIEKIIKDAVGDSFPETFELYDEVIEKQYTRSKYLYEQVNEEFIPYEQNQKLQQMTSALIQQSNDELYNITKSLGFKVDMGNGKTVFTPLSEYYNEYLDNAMVEITSGAFDYNTVIRRVVSQMTNSGLRTVDYASGFSSRCDVAARRAIMTGLTQLTGKISDMNAQKLHTEYFEIDWHAGARPTHREWQGKVWSRKELITVCGLGTVAGLEGANCYYIRYPFIPGVSERQYSDSWLKEQNQKEDVPKAFRGREYTTYEATQRQRYLETNMRAQRQKVRCLQEAGAGSEEVILAKCKYQAQLDEYKAFSKKMGLREQRERIYYDMKGRVAPSKEVYREYLKNIEEKRNQKLQSPLKNSMIKIRTLNDCRTTEDVEYFLKEKKWFHVQTIGDVTYDTNNKISLKGCSLECAKEIVKAHEEVFKKYPQLIGKLNSVTAVKLDTMVYAQCFMGTGHGGITVNTTYFSGKDKISRLYEKDLQYKFHPQGTSWDAVVTHEIGHAIDDYLTNTLSMAGIVRGKNKYVSALLRPKVMGACKLSVNRIDVANFVSGYAAENSKEWFAECFAEYMKSKNPRTVAAEFGRQLDELMKGVK